MSRALPMSLEEATSIRRYAREGVLDLELPGTQEEVRLAERTCADADLWGRTPADRRRSRVAVGVIVATTVVITGIALVPYSFG